MTKMDLHTACVMHMRLAWPHWVGVLVYRMLVSNKIFFAEFARQRPLIKPFECCKGIDSRHQFHLFGQKSKEEGILNAFNLFKRLAAAIQSTCSPSSV